MAREAGLADLRMHRLLLKTAALSIFSADLCLQRARAALAAASSPAGGGEGGAQSSSALAAAATSGTRDVMAADPAFGNAITLLTSIAATLLDACAKQQGLMFGCLGAAVVILEWLQVREALVRVVSGQGVI
jgi:hypothetical protein